MLGGTVVNITGPCFFPNERVTCRFDTERVQGHVVDKNRAICVQPPLFAQGYVRFEVAIGTENFKWKGRYFVGELNPVDFNPGNLIHTSFNSLHRNTGNGNRTDLLPWRGCF